VVARRAQAQVAEVRGRNERRRAIAVLGVARTEGGVATAEERVDLVVEPRLVAKLERGPERRRQRRQEFREQPGVLACERRELKQDGAELFAERRRRAPEIAEQLSRPFEALNVRDAPRGFQRERETRRALRPPALEQRRLGR